MTLAGRTILLVISGGIAAYKSLDLIRRLRERGASVRVILTAGAQQFITPLAAGAVSGGRVFIELFEREAEHDIGHIRLAREADLVLVAPLSANLMARMAQGLAGDLAGAVLLATRAPILAAPAMNPAMWAHPATARNAARLRETGVAFIGPESGEMAESGEAGLGRMSEPVAIAEAAEALLADGPLKGRHVVVTAGPTHEPIDPVRYIANRSSGKQGYAIAAAAARAGARVTLVSGPVALPVPPGVTRVAVEAARDMLAAVEAALPADIAIMVAAVADWRPASRQDQKMKKTGDDDPPPLALAQNPDILRTVSQPGPRRPGLVIGFAAETENLIENAVAKRARKGCDLIVANDVSGDVMGGDANSVVLVDASGTTPWPPLSKTEVADRLVAWAAARMA